MSLDTKYRPTSYRDVLGQEATKKILKQFVITGTGYNQSYLFAGPFGSGKTTLGRILARALLCDSPVEGEPCNKCPSCVSILENGTSESFIEMDAATNSGKADILKITESLDYQTFTGKRRIYLLDESHALSTQALDGLLKPLEETIPGTEQKRLVCIFCTTEPERMRDTILSRCAPAFVIEPVVPAQIAERLAEVCQKEGVEYDLDVLKLIAEAKECHIRDCLKAIEGVRMLGPINRENVVEYLHLDQNASYVDVLLKLEKDLAGALALVESLSQRVAPSVLYQKLMEVSMCAYHVFLGSKNIPVYWDAGKLKELSQKGEVLLHYARRFATRPNRPHITMLHCDLASLHRKLPESSMVVIASHQGSPTNGTHTSPVNLGSVNPDTLVTASIQTGVYVDPRAINREPRTVVRQGAMTAEDAARILNIGLTERGQSRSTNLGSSGADPAR